MMRLRRRITLSCRATAARPLVAAVAMVALLGLTACAGDSPLKLPVPPHANVPEVSHDSYPSIGTTARSGRQPLTEPQRAALQRDLEQLSREREAKVMSAIQSGN